jgi:DNA-binding NtrC family response regulator
MTEPGAPAAARIARVLSTLMEPATRRVLVVDDEEPIRMAITKFLKARGYDVAAADGGAAALALLAEGRFDALLCDVRMPGMSGTDVVPRALELQPGLAVLMLTAVSDAPTATEAIARGAMEYLMKPVGLDDLANAVDRALRARNLELQQMNVERMIREEVAIRTEELRLERARLADVCLSIVAAITTGSPARGPLSAQAAIETIANSTATPLDPAVVAALRRIISGGASLHFFDEAR